MSVKQISVFVQNENGALAKLLSTLAENKIELRALSIADTNDFGILRIITDNPEKTLLALGEDGYISRITDVVAACISDRPGGLAEQVTLLSDSDITVEYLYAFVTRQEQQACVILRVNDNEKAEKILKNAGIKLLDKDDIANL